MNSYVYFDHKTVPKDKAVVGIDTHALHYGCGYFGGIRGYWNDQAQALFIFRLQDHVRRFKRSGKLLGLKLPDDVDSLERIIVELVKRNNYQQNVYIRPLVYVSEQTLLSFDLGKLETALAVTTVPLEHYLNVSAGIRVMTSSWTRQPTSAIPPRAKPTGIYLNTALANTEAKANGYDEALFLTKDGLVSEGSAENIFLLINNQLVTPSIDSDILVGITRTTIIELAREELGVKMVERKVKPAELVEADEVFFTGTGAEVTPVVQIDQAKIGRGQPGELTIKLQRLYFEIVYGRNKKYRHWLTEIKY